MEVQTMRLTTIAALLLVGAGAAQAGGTVNVSFIDPEHFTDAGERSYYYSPNVLKVIDQYLQDLGQRYLADGQVLKIDVTNIDLAGWLRPMPNRGEWVRVLRGRADFPRIALRYTLESNGQVTKQGEETLADLDYTNVLRPSTGEYEMRYERLMLEAWFKA